MVPSPEVPPVTPPRVIVVALIRVVATIALLVVAFYLLPFDALTGPQSVALLVLGLLGVVLIVVLQVKAILNAKYPGIKAVEGLAVIAPLFLLLFSTAYYLLERATPTSFSQTLTRTNALYFTVTTFSTVGFGDITARAQSAQVMVTVQMLADLIILGFGVKIIFGAVQIGRQRQTAPTEEGTPAPSAPVADAPVQGQLQNKARQRRHVDHHPPVAPRPLM